ncbi:MAG TPA: VOC family protein [Thermodesulfobacteriota bacterium]|nr:VOC family protein [Thermodesulfobacteriota bacterium]
MKTRLAHVSITVKDLDRLAEFYRKALGFTEVRPEKGFSGAWLEKGTGVPGASIRRVHLRLPGSSPDVALLELIEYAGKAEDKSPPAADSTGLRHIAIETGSASELARLRDLVIENGGSGLGDISENRIDGLGTVTFIYMTDPEGNIVELLNWRESL